MASIGMQMDLKTLVDRPMLLVLGVIWISVHAALMLGMAKLIRAPLFFMAVGSQANIGGAASAPIVASAFHPALAPVGVLLAVLGYALGTYCAYITGLLLQAIAGRGLQPADLSQVAVQAGGHRPATPDPTPTADAAVQVRPVQT